MITVISGTNRPNSNTREVAGLVYQILVDHDVEADLLDLSDLPAELFVGTSYALKPKAFASFQKTVLAADGFLVVVPEYNGSFPGVLKYFIDMLKFPDSLYEKPAAFIGLSSGRWGGVRAVEQLEMVFQYRHAHLFGRRCFIPSIGQALGEDGTFTDQDLFARVRKTVTGFATFCGKLQQESD
jgi:NAD(P)H-dependent FMN reductase